MIVSHLKRLNPTMNKKCLFLCNSMPIIHEMTSYLKSQIGLSVFYSNSRISLKKIISKFDEADVCMFKMDEFLKVFPIFFFFFYFWCIDLPKCSCHVYYMTVIKLLFSIYRPWKSFINRDKPSFSYTSFQSFSHRFRAFLTILKGNAKTVSNHLKE